MRLTVYYMVRGNPLGFHAISDGTLKAKLIGRSWRVKRSDLDQFVAGLF